MYIIYYFKDINSENNMWKQTENRRFTNVKFVSLLRLMQGFIKLFQLLFDLGVS